MKGLIYEYHPRSWKKKQIYATYLALIDCDILSVTNQCDLSGFQASIWCFREN